MEDGLVANERDEFSVLESEMKVAIGVERGRMCGWYMKPYEGKS
jgi:hypothetical protein